VRFRLVRARREFVLALCGIVLHGVVPAFAVSPGETLRKYLGARLSGDLPAAELLWDRDDLRRSQALGIFYAPLEAKYDDHLLLTAEERAALAASARVVVADSVLEPGFARYTVVLAPRAAAGAADTMAYSLRATGDTWVVTSPYAKRTAGWTAREGRFVRFRASKLRHVNRQALAALDASVLAMFERLQTPEAARLRLERIKLEYYLCADDAEVQLLTGRRAATAFRLGGARVVTRHAADLNAVARAVVHLTLRDAPPFAPPLLEDGFAAALGGWDTWSAGVTLQHGAALVAADPTMPADAGLRTGAREPSLAAAMWSDALFQQLGAARFLELYRGMSGSATQARGRDTAALRQAIEAATTKRGPALESAVRDQARKFVPPITAGCASWPVETQTLQPYIRWRDPEEIWALEVFEMGSEYVATLGPYQGPLPAWAQRMIDSLQTTGKKPTSDPKPKAARPAGDPPQISLLFRERLVAEPDAFDSPLFASQFAKRRYAGDLVGIFIRPDGLEMWDYRRGILIGKIAPSIALPADAKYYDKTAGRICFRIQRDLLPQPLVEHLAVCNKYTGE